MATVCLLPEPVEHGDICKHVEDVVGIGRVIVVAPLVWVWSGVLKLMDLCLALIVHTVKSRHLGGEGGFLHLLVMKSLTQLHQRSNLVDLHPGYKVNSIR